MCNTVGHGVTQLRLAVCGIPPPSIHTHRYYELAVGDGQEAKVGDRVAVHFDVRLRNITIATSR